MTTLTARAIFEEYLPALAERDLAALDALVHPDLTMRTAIRRADARSRQPEGHVDAYAVREVINCQASVRAQTAPLLAEQSARSRLPYWRRSSRHSRPYRSRTGEDEK